MIDLEQICQIAYEAGEKIMEIYTDPDQDVELDPKADDSPLTKADLAAHNHIVARLEAAYPEIALLSEESAEISDEERLSWDRFWCIDPLDGTKEFIKRNGEFTVNIALIENKTSVLGVVYLPVKKKMYIAQSGTSGTNGTGALCIDCSDLGTEVGDMKQAELDLQKATKIQVKSIEPGAHLRIVGSRSHHAPEVEQYVQKLVDLGYTTEFVPAGSSLKFCLVAEGSADLYPRFVPTMERDTAAAQCVLEQAGGVIQTASGGVFQYQKDNLRNDFFVAAADASLIVV